MLNFKCEQNRLPSNQSWDQGTRFGPIMKMKISSKADKTNLQAKCRASSPVQVSHWGDQKKQPHPRLDQNKAMSTRKTWTPSPWAALQVMDIDLDRPDLLAGAS